MSNFPIPDKELVERVMHNLRNRGVTPVVRWGLVRDAFGVGSTTASALCERFGLNPDELIQQIEREE